MSRSRVSILSPDLAGNAIGRAYVLAKLLQDDFDVHIVAHGEGKVWGPIREDPTVEYRPFHRGRAAGFVADSRRTVRRLVDGHLILAVKPLLPSFGLGLTARRVLRRPLLLDIDDWEIGFLSDSVYWEVRLLGHQWFAATGSPLYTRLLDRVTARADAVTVSNRFLQQRYGGTWVPHARDARAFRRTPGQSGDGVPTVLFLGTARSNKGLDVLLAAWPRVTHPAARLRIVGTPPDAPIIRALRARADHRVSFEGPVPFDQMPDLVTSAGVVVIPQQAGAASVGQLPAKLMDAMAAGRPVVSTAVGDIPVWLAGGAGVIVPAGDPAALGAAIHRVLDEPAAAREMGTRARDRFLRYGAMEAVRPRLVALVDALIRRRPLPPPAPAFARETENPAPAAVG